MSSELQTFDGLDNRREVMILLQRLGTDQDRAAFLTRIAGRSRNGFAQCRTQIVGHCDAVTAYYMFVSLCNELSVSVNEAARRLEAEVRQK